jgi:hypothetical protein
MKRIKTNPIGYKVTLKSKQNNLYSCSIMLSEKEDAIKEAHNKIYKLGWEHFQCKIHDIIPIFDANLQIKD